MPNGTTDDQRRRAKEALYEKQIALVRYVQLLYTRQSEDPDLVQLERGRADIELNLTIAMIQELNSSRPVMFPDGNSVARLRGSAAALTQLVQANSALNDMIEAADDLIRSWPD